MVDKIVFTSDFTGSRFGTCSDLELTVWQSYFDELEEFSNRYLQSVHELEVWPGDYPWPWDSLHCNTRLWEYPFVLDAIQRFGPKKGRLFDVGSALTFFPCFMASRGHRVVASDADPRMKSWAHELWRVDKIRTSWAPNDLSYEVVDITNLPARPDSFDIVTNISVLEHLPIQSLTPTISGIRSMLKRDGLFVCTFDCWIKGQRTDEHHPLDHREFNSFLNALMAGFRLVEEPRFRLPCDLLTNIHYPISLTSHALDKPKGRSRLRRLRSRFGRAVRGFQNHTADAPLEWCAFGIALQKI